MTGIFHGPLIVEDVNGETWTLVRPLAYIDEDGTRYDVPAGFVTDFASIPRGFWNLYPKVGKHNRAAVVHDWLCVTRPIDSASVHAVFKRALKACGVNKFNRAVMFSMVRVFGPRFDAVTPIG